MEVNFLEKSIRQLILPIQIKTCSPHEPLKNILEYFKQMEIGSIVVTNSEHQPIGIFTERDFIQKIAGLSLNLEQETVESYMTPNPIYVNENESIKKVLLHMRMGRFRHVIVVDDERKLVSVISIKDMIDYFCDQVPSFN